MSELTKRERVLRALHYQPVDKPPVEIYYSPVGYYEHGDKLNDLYESLSDDFEPFKRVSVPVLTANNFDADGRYHELKKDEWGVTWEYRVFGVQGIPFERPIKSEEDINSYNMPIAPIVANEGYEKLAEHIRTIKSKKYPAHVHCGNLYERMIALYGDENVLCDILMNESGINKLADKIIEYNSVFVRKAVKAGADFITFGDDYGTERSMIMDPDTWRSFFKPRLKRLFQPAVEAGLDIVFHSCGQVSDILPDLREIGATAIWPQLPAYSMEELAKRCRELGLAVKIHTDRANTMTFGTPQQVKELVKREFEVFKMADGGSWFYVEADNGFPYENIEALVEAINEYR